MRIYTLCRWDNGCWSIEDNVNNISGLRVTIRNAIIWLFILQAPLGLVLAGVEMTDSQLREI